MENPVQGPLADLLTSPLLLATLQNFSPITWYRLWFGKKFNIIGYDATEINKRLGTGLLIGPTRHTLSKSPCNRIGQPTFEYGFFFTIHLNGKNVTSRLELEKTGIQKSWQENESPFDWKEPGYDWLRSPWLFWEDVEELYRAVSEHYGPPREVEIRFDSEETVFYDLL